MDVSVSRKGRPLPFTSGPLRGKSAGRLRLTKIVALLICAATGPADGGWIEVRRFR